MSRTPIYGPGNPQRNLLGVKLVARVAQNHFGTEAAKAAA